MTLDFATKTFRKEPLRLLDKPEGIVRGGRHLFEKLPEAFEGINQIGVIGWGSQGPAQAQNLRDSLVGTDIKVKVGLRPGSRPRPRPREAGFTEDERHARRDVRRRPRVRPRAAAHLRRRPGPALPAGVRGHAARAPRSACPTASCSPTWRTSARPSRTTSTSSPSARRAWARRCGRSTCRAPRSTAPASTPASPCTRTSTAGRPTIALGWSVALGSPYTFQTTLESEYKSDIFGERGILLGAVHGIVESLFRRLVEHGTSREDRLLDAGREHHRADLPDTISHEGIQSPSTRSSTATARRPSPAPTTPPTTPPSTS